MQAHVRVMSEQFVPRAASHPETLERSAEYIRTAFAGAGARTSFQPMTTAGHEYKNVIAQFGPETGPRIVVGAHYDAFYTTPGANDNASGVAGIIELAKLVGTEEPDITIEFVAYTLEEPPWFATRQMGSAVHADSAHREDTEIVLAVVLEMIGDFNDEAESKSCPLPLLGLLYPRRGNFIAVVGRLDQRSAVLDVKQAMNRATPLPVCSINAPEALVGIDFSDHRSYWVQDIRAVMVTDTAFYRYDGYHESSDTAERLDYRRMAMVVDGVYAAIVAAAEKIQAEQ